MKQIDVLPASGAGNSSIQSGQHKAYSRCPKSEDKYRVLQLLPDTGALMAFGSFRLCCVDGAMFGNTAPGVA